jgi:hypothetical protein
MSRVVPVAAVAAVSLIAAGGAGAASPQVHAARSCNISGQERSLGASYVTSLSVRHTSCAKGKAVTRAYQACRRAHGWKGKCGHRVKGFKCRRHIQTSSPVQYDAKVTCRRGGKRVTHTYTQFT